MKRIFALTLVLLATAFAAQAQVWTNLPADKQAALIRAHTRYTFAVTNLPAFRYATNALPSAWVTNEMGTVSVKATTNQVVEVNPPLASRQLFYLRFYNEADADEKTVRVREAILWRRLVEANAAAAEAIANDRESR